MTRRLFVCLLACGLSAPVGCGGGKPDPAAATGPTTADALADFALLLKDFQQLKGRPPASQTAFAGQDAGNPAASAALARKDIVYYWGEGLSGGTAIIAYDAKTPTAGGPVLLQDGTVKTLTAAEFAAAPKAGKK